MGKKILVVIDMQNDFITGSLANPAAEAIIPNIKNEIENGGYDYYLFTKDAHCEDYLQTAEGKKLPVAHCIRGTWGFEICDALNPDVLLKDASCRHIAEKPSFGGIAAMSYLSNWVGSGSDCEITFVGTCTDICVISNVMIAKALFPEAGIKVKAGCCAGLTVESHENALAAMRMCQIDVE